MWLKQGTFYTMTNDKISIFLEHFFDMYEVGLPFHNIFSKLLNIFYTLEKLKNELLEFEYLYFCYQKLF